MSNTEKTRREQRELTGNCISDFKKKLRETYAVDVEMGRLVTFVRSITRAKHALFVFMNVEPIRRSSGW